MIVLNIASEHQVFTEKAETMEDLKRIVLDEYNVKGFKFYIGNNEESATSFHSLFGRTRATK